MSMMGKMSFFLALQISQSPRGIFVNQSKYALKIINKYDMESSDSVDTPMVDKAKLDKDLMHVCPISGTAYRKALTCSKTDLSIPQRDSTYGSMVFEVNADLLRNALRITPKDLDHPFTLPALEKEIISFINELGCSKKATAYDRPRLTMLQLLWEWFTKLIIKYILSQNNQVSKRPLSFQHVIKLDATLGNLKFIIKGQLDLIFGMPIPDIMLSNEIKASEDYHKYMAKVLKAHEPSSAKSGGTVNVYLNDDDSMTSGRCKNAEAKMPLMNKLTKFLLRSEYLGKRRHLNAISKFNIQAAVDKSLMLVSRNYVGKELDQIGQVFHNDDAGSTSSKKAWDLELCLILLSKSLVVWEDEWTDRPETPDHDWHKEPTANDAPKQPWFNEIVNTQKDSNTHDDNLEGDKIPQDFSKPLQLQGAPGRLTIIVDLFFNKDLEYLTTKNLGERKYATSLTKPKSASHWGLKQKLFYKSKQAAQSNHHVYSRLRILSINKLYYLHGDIQTDLAVALWFFIRRTILKHRVKDVQLGVESYQTKLNLTRPHVTHPSLGSKELFTIFHKPRGVVYPSISGKKCLMREDEVYKFGDATIMKVRDELKYRLYNFNLDYNKDMLNRKWSVKDQKRIESMLKVLEKTLHRRRIIRSLKCCVGERKLETDYRLLTWID
ncbi:hypothetical protein Tco_1549527, partial [Tanacetum coccineum]